MTIKRFNDLKINGSYAAEFSPLILRKLPEHNGRRPVYALARSFKVRIFHAAGVLDYEAPEGYKTDLASIPWIFQWFLGPRDEYAEEAVIHDILCEKKMPRFFTNATMRIIMEVLHRPKRKILVIYYGLMLFGYGSPLFNLFTKRQR